MVLHRAVPDDVEQFGILEHVALDEEVVRDLDLVVGQRDDHFFRSIRLIGEMLSEALPNGYLGRF